VQEFYELLITKLMGEGRTIITNIIITIIVIIIMIIIIIIINSIIIMIIIIINSNNMNVVFTFFRNYTNAPSAGNLHPRTRRH
jgi:hypothetical protein